MAIVATIGVSPDDAEAEDSVGHGPGMQNVKFLFTARVHCSAVSGGSGRPWQVRALVQWSGSVSGKHANRSSRARAGLLHERLLLRLRGVMQLQRHASEHEDRDR